LLTSPADAIVWLWTRSLFKFEQTSFRADRPFIV
jgi:hypothetical protein